MLGFPQFFGNLCAFDEILSVSGAGAFTFDYKSPYLYVTDEGTSGDGILKIYNVADAAGPVLLSTTSLPVDTSPREPRAFGNLLLIPYKQAHALGIWDITNRSSPTLLNQLDLSTDVSGANGPTGVTMSGDIAAVTYGFGFTMNTTLRQIDLTNPASPVLGATLRPFNPAIVSSGWSILTLNGNFVATGVVTGGSSNAYVVTIDPSAFTALDFFSASGSGGSTSILSSDEVGHVYFYDGANDVVWSVDCTNPSNITGNSSALIVGGGSGALHTTCVVAETDRLYMGRAGGGGLGMYILDIEDRDDPVEVGFISSSGETVTCMRRVDGCPGFAWGQGTGAAIHLLGEAPLS